MKRNILEKILLVFIFLINTLLITAQSRGGVNNGTVSLPPGYNPSGGLGGVGTGGRPKNPIDMYTTILFIVAVSIIVGVYFYQKRKNMLLLSNKINE